MKDIFAKLVVPGILILFAFMVYVMVDNVNILVLVVSLALIEFQSSIEVGSIKTFKGAILFALKFLFIIAALLLFKFKYTI